MLHRHLRCLTMLAAATLVASCADPPSPGGAAQASCDEAGARAVVQRLGERLNEVSLLAPDSVVVRRIGEVYAPMVTPDLLAAWTAEPAHAPGRQTSSPWPERIEVLSVESVGVGACRVEAEVVYVTSVEVADGGAAAREPVVFRVVEADGWRIAAYEGTAPQTTDPAAPEDAASPDTAGRDAGENGGTAAGAAEAAHVIRRYYEAIAAGEYERAYGLWSDGGAASGQTLEAFATGFAETATVVAEIGEPGRVEPAAGSRYVRVPVVIRATTVSEERQRFEGTYTLRRSVVPGASDEQRRWRILAADVARSP